MRQTNTLRRMVESRKTVIAPGAYDAFSAMLVEKAGFDAIYVGSFATEAALLGKPDLALMSKVERLWIVRNIAKAVNIPMIADAEEGFGNALGVIETVRDFEAAGAAAIHLDDERIPSRCPMLSGLPYTPLVSVDEMCGKIEAAVHTRQDPDFMIIARSDVIGTMPRGEYYQVGMEEVVKRSKAYAAAGADAIFVIAFDENELRHFVREIRAPIVGIFAHYEPIPFEVFQRTGCAMAVGSISCLYSAAKGMMKALSELKRTGDWNAVLDDLISEEEFAEIMKIPEYQELYRRFRIS